MKYLVLGGHGMLGTDLRAVLTGHDVVAPTRAELDLGDLDALRATAAGCDAVVNCAAYTRVDDAETDAETAMAVNADGAHNAAIAAADNSAGFVQVSTDYVFDGTATAPYPEDAPIHPVSVYGASKAEGERRVREAHPGAYVVRAAWLYGRQGSSFPKAVLARAASHGSVDVVTDQTGQPTWTRDLAAAIRRLLESDAPAGIYHGTNAGSTTWFEFARSVFTAVGLDPDRVHPTDSSAFPRPAPRPAYSVLGHDAWGAAGLPAPRDWREALVDAARAEVFG